MPDLDRLMKRAADSPSIEPDIERAWSKGRILRTRRRIAASLGAMSIVVVSVVAVDAVVSNQERNTNEGVAHEDDTRAEEALASPRERAATVAIAALSSADLHDPTGTYYDYGAVEDVDQGWVAYFCLTSPSSGVCDPDTSDSNLVVAREGADLVVVEASGAFDEEAKTLLVGYRESAAPPPPRQVFGPWRLDEDVVAEPAYVADTYWTGAIPSRLEATCRLEALNDSGDVIYESREIPSHGPRVEGARDGVMGSQLPPRLVAAEVRMRCDDYDYKPPPRPPDPPEGPGRTVASGTLPQDASPEFAGVEWQVLAWSESDRYCWGLVMGDTPKPQLSCTPWEIESDEIIQGWGFTSSDDETQAFASGQVNADVDRVEFRLGSRTVKGELLVPPEDMEIPTRFFVSFLPSLETGKLVAMDQEGNVLDTARIRLKDGNPALVKVVIDVRTGCLADETTPEEHRHEATFVEGSEPTTPCNG